MSLRDRETLFRWKVIDLKKGKIVSHHTKRKFALQKIPLYCLQNKRNPAFVIPVYIPPGCNVIPARFIKRIPSLEKI